MERHDRLVLVPALLVAASLALAGGSALAAGDDDAAASMAPGASLVPAASLDPASLGPGLHVVGAWSRESPMMELAGAAFLTVYNNTEVDDALVGVSSPAAAVAELHQTTQAEDGTMTMAPVDEVPIPAGGAAELKPGGYHIMLIDLVQPLVEGDQIVLALEFANAESQIVMVPVQAIGPMAGALNGIVGDEVADDDSVTGENGMIAEESPGGEAQEPGDDDQGEDEDDE